jgi:hypothetical protein
MKAMGGGKRATDQTKKSRHVQPNDAIKTSGVSVKDFEHYFSESSFRVF